MAHSWNWPLVASLDIQRGNHGNSTSGSLYHSHLEIKNTVTTLWECWYIRLNKSIRNTLEENVFNSSLLFDDYLVVFHTAEYNDTRAALFMCKEVYFYIIMYLQPKFLCHGKLGFPLSTYHVMQNKTLSLHPVPLVKYHRFKLLCTIAWPHNVTMNRTFILLQLKGAKSHYVIITL